MLSLYLRASQSVAHWQVRGGRKGDGGEGSKPASQTASIWPLPLPASTGVVREPNPSACTVAAPIHKLRGGVQRRGVQH